MDAAPVPCGTLSDYLANQVLLQSLTISSLDVTIVDELGLSYRAVLQLSPRRHHLVLADPSATLDASSLTDTENVVRGDDWLSIPLACPATAITLSPTHQPYRLDVRTDDLHLAIERSPPTSVQHLCTVLSRLCRAAKAPLSDHCAAPRTGTSSPPHDVRPRSSASPPAVSAASPLGTEILCQSLERKLAEVRDMRRDLVASADWFRTEAQRTHAEHADPSPWSTPARSGIASRLTDVSGGAVATGLFDSHVSPPRVPTAEVVRLRQLERPRAPCSPGQSLGTLGSVGPRSDDASAMRLYREIRGSSLSSLTEPGLAASEADEDSTL